MGCGEYRSEDPLTSDIKSLFAHYNAVLNIKALSYAKVCFPNVLVALHGSLVVIGDAYKQHASQQNTNYHGRKSAGIWGFRNEVGVRRVLTTRSDDELHFSFSQGNCYVS